MLCLMIPRLTIWLDVRVEINTGAVTRKGRDRINTCRQKITTKQRCSRTKKGENRSRKSRKSKDFNKVKEEKRSAYLQVDLTDNELRSVLKKFPDRILLEVPGMKKNRMKAFQCKLAAYETKKKKILKMVPQEGLKKTEVERTARNMKKINDRKTEKSTKRKTSDEKDSLEQEERQVSENLATQKERQVSENLATQKESQSVKLKKKTNQNDPRNKDFWKFDRHIPIPTRNKIQGFLTKNPSPAVLKISQDIQPAEKSFSKVLLNSCDNSSSINPFPVLESSLHQKEYGTVQFSKRRRLNGFFEMENQTYEQVSSTETSAQIQFSGHSTPKDINHLESLQPRRQEIIEESFESKHLTQTFSQMRLNMNPGEQKKMILITDGSKILDSSELKDVSSEATKLNGIESKNGEITHSNDFKKQIRKLSVIGSKIQVQQPLNQVNNPSSRENFHANKNTNDFKFSAPIYHDVDLTQSDYETSFDSSNNSEDIPSIENCEISNSPIYSASCGLPEPFSSPNSSTSITIINHSQAYRCAISEKRSEADGENRSHTIEGKRTFSSSSKSVLSEQSSCDSCLESSSSSDVDEDSMLVE